MSRIVIIGAGPAGINAAQTFAKQLKPSDNTEVVVLEKSKYYYHTIGTPRAYTEEAYTPKLFVPYDDAIPANAKSFVRIVRAVATGILADQNQVTYQPVGSDDQPSSETRTVSFDYLIIATGSTYTVPIKPDPNNFSRAATEQKLREVRDQITRANSILIVGGGAVGCEVAGDIAAHFPTKKVTLLEGRDKLIAANNIKDKVRTKLMDSLKELKVEVILGERLEERLTGNSFGPRALRTTRGRVIESDVQLLCGGFSPVVDLVAAMDPSLIDNNGSVRVNDLLQLDHPRYAHIFALGDMTNHNTPKMSYWAGEQAKHLAAELVAVFQKKQARVSKPFPPVATEMLMMPLGPDGGVGQLPVFGGWVVGNFMVRMIKSKDMFAGMIWGSLGASAPK